MSAHVTRARAYLLIEAAVTGVIVAVMIMGLVNLLGSARDDEIRAARKAVASDIALGHLGQLTARGYERLAAGTTTQTVQPANSGRYEVTTVLTGGSDNVAVAAPTSATVNVRYFDARVEVKFGTPARTVAVQGRIYEARLE
jgi:hypothetical protein